MKTLEQIKEEYAKSHAFNDWKSMYSYLGLLQRQSAMDEIAKRYADECAKEALRLASENVKLGISEYRTRKDGSIGWVVTESKNLFIINDGCNICATKESILNKNNLPSHS